MSGLTRLGFFITENGIVVATLARECGYSRQHIRRLRLGECEPTLPCMVNIRKACRRILQRDVRMLELFDLGTDDALDIDAPSWLVGNCWRERLIGAIRVTGRLQSDIAYKAGIAEKTVSRIVTGQSKNPALDTVVCLARAIGVTVGWLLDERGYGLSVHQVQRLRDASTIIDEVTGGGE